MRTVLRSLICVGGATLSYAASLAASPLAPEAKALRAALPGVQVDDATAEGLVGTYALRSRLATIQSTPVIGKTPSLSSRYGIVTIGRDGEGLNVTETNCHIDVVGKGPAVASIPDAFTRAIPVTTAPLRVWRESEGVPLQFAKDAVPTVVGALLENPDQDALPTVPTDPRVIDQDQDGKPGVTIKIDGSLIKGSIYLVQRLNYSWAGTVDAEMNLKGLIQDSGDQSILDASNPILKTKVPVVNDPDASKSDISFVRINGVYDCDRLAQEKNALFPAN